LGIGSSFYRKEEEREEEERKAEEKDNPESRGAGGPRRRISGTKRGELFGSPLFVMTPRVPEERFVHVLAKGLGSERRTRATGDVVTVLSIGGGGL
jgi:hypothetical protein